MAIYAKANNTNTIRIIEELKDGQALFYDSRAGSFTNRFAHNLSQNFNLIENLGGENTIDIYAGRRGTTALLRSLTAGPNITLEQDEHRVTISADTVVDNLSVEGDFSVTIDNNNDQADAVFKVKTARSTSENPIIIKPNVLATYTSDKIYTGIDYNTNPEQPISYIQSYDVDFKLCGFKKGMFIRLRGTDYQDGDFTIRDIIDVFDHGKKFSRILLIEDYIGNQLINLGGPKPESTITEADLVVLPLSEDDIDNINNYDDSKNYEIVSYSKDFGPSGYDLKKDMIIYLKNTSGYDGYYHVEKVIPKGNTPFENSVIIVNWQTPIPGETGLLIEDDNLNPKIEIEVKSFAEDTGFSVNKEGEISSPTISMLLKKIHELETKVSALEKK